MIITPEQAAAIRAPARVRGHVEIDGVRVDYQDMRTLLRLGLAVIESGVSADAAKRAATACWDSVDDKSARALDAIALELERLQQAERAR